MLQFVSSFCICVYQKGTPRTLFCIFPLWFCHLLTIHLTTSSPIDLNTITLLFYYTEMKTIFQRVSNLHSMRLFCRGVPVRMILLLDLILFIHLDMAEASFFSTWPSSHTTRSGPTEKKRQGIALWLERA